MVEIVHSETKYCFYLDIPDNCPKENASYEDQARWKLHLDKKIFDKIVGLEELSTYGEHYFTVVALEDETAKECQARIQKILDNWKPIFGYKNVPSDA